METSGSDLNSRLDVIGERTRPAVLERLEVIQLATGEAATGDQLAAGRAEAHKLNGLLGTLGLARGSELAAAIESDLESVAEGRASDGWAARVRRMAAELRAEIESD